MSSLYFESGLTEHSAKEARPCLDLHRYKIDCRNFSGVFKYFKYFQVFSNIPNIFRCFQIFQISSGAWSTTQVGSCLDGDCQPRISSPEVTPNICAFWSDRIFVAFSFNQTKYLYLLIWSDQIFLNRPKTTPGFLLLRYPLCMASNLDGNKIDLVFQWCSWWARHPEAKSYREESGWVFR